jgi:ABC-2 type transport system ATP-binding protein
MNLLSVLTLDKFMFPRSAGETDNFANRTHPPAFSGRMAPVEDISDGQTRVEIQGLWVRFGAVAAVRGIDLTAHAGRATALLGRNGAGKSTTMRVLAGVIPPTEGTVLVDGVDVAKDLLAVKRLTGYCPDVGGLVPRATPWEHLQLAARLRRLEAWEDRAQDLLERFDLGAAAHRVTSGFSHGMGRRLSVILACFHEPTVLLLDEPFDGVDPLGVEATLEVIADARARGAAVLVSTHLRDLAMTACENALVLRGGATVAELRANELVGEEGAGVYRALLD